jgi:hypothetical protein
VEAEADDRGGGGGARLRVEATEGAKKTERLVCEKEREENIPGMRSWGVLRAFCSCRCSSSNTMLKDGEATRVGLNSEG